MMFPILRKIWVYRMHSKIIGVAEGVGDLMSSGVIKEEENMYEVTQMFFLSRNSSAN